MHRHSFRSKSTVIGLLGLWFFVCGASGVYAAGGEDESTIPNTFEELVKRSAAAYQAAPCLEVTLTTVVDIPPDPPQQRVVRYLLGKDRQAVLEIGSLLKVVVTDDTVFIERAGVADHYLEAKAEGDLAAALAAVRGRFLIAGFWVPPQTALREGKPMAELIDTFRYSGLMGELSLAGFERTSSFYEATLVADNGSCIARFDPETFHLEQVEHHLEPKGAPEGYRLHLLGRFTTKQLPKHEADFSFSRGDRQAVESIRDLAAGTPELTKSPGEILPPEQMARRLIDTEQLVAALRPKRVLLVGETHRYEEPPAYLVSLLEQLDDRAVSLLLEMPRDAQPAIDRYLCEGDEAILQEIFTGKPVLQLQTILLWAHQNRDRVPTVLAFDESQYEIRMKRSYLADTRNVTMSHAILRQWQEHPERRIVAYAGSLHVMKNGRYKVDEPSRVTAAARLPDLGIDGAEIACVWLNGADNFPLHSTWTEPGVFVAAGAVRIPLPYFIDYPIFGVAFADEAFDYFVNLGPLTRIEVERPG
jgi:hypothetical protein